MPTSACVSRITSSPGSAELRRESGRDRDVGAGNTSCANELVWARHGKLMRSTGRFKGRDLSRLALWKGCSVRVGRRTRRRPPGGHLSGTQVGRRAAWTKAVAPVTLGTEEGDLGDGRGDRRRL